MKNKAIFFMLITSLMINISCGNAQKNIENEHSSNLIQHNSCDEQINIVKEFYTAYADLWSVQPPLDPDIFSSKCDSLMTKYCTEKIKNAAHGWFEDGHDLLTGDWGIDTKSLNSLTILKDSIKSDFYLISYSIKASEPVKIYTYNVILNVKVVKERDIYKISEVKDEGTTIEKL